MQADDDESEWIARCQMGDPEAFAPLVHAHERMIHSLTYRMTGSFADAEDLAQETFVRAYRQIGSFRRTAKFSTWLYSIAFNLSFNWRQKAARRVRVDGDWARSSNSGEQPPEDDMSRRVQAALLELPMKQRAAIILTVYEDLTHAEAASILRCTE